MVAPLAKSLAAVSPGVSERTQGLRLPAKNKPKSTTNVSSCPGTVKRMLTMGVAFALGNTAAASAVMRGASVGVDALSRRSTSSTANQFTYFAYNGGPLIQNANVTSVYWNENVTFTNELDRFYASITNTPYFAIAQQYGTPEQPIGAGHFGGRLMLNKTSTFVDDVDIQATLASLVQTGRVANNTHRNTVLMFHFPPNTFLSQRNWVGCRDFTAYHSAIQVNGTLFPYGVVPDQGGLCEKVDQLFSTTPNATYDPLMQTTIASSHELLELVTDPGVGLAINSNDTRPIGPPFGWIDLLSGNEIADACEGTESSVAGWTVQKIWSEIDQGCVAQVGELTNNTTS
jgi:hypothetical protein